MKEKKSMTGIFLVNLIWLGMQGAFALVIAYTSPIFQYLGASDTLISYLWIAIMGGGLVTQLLIGKVSDITIKRYGGRKPYLLLGTILSAVSLYLFPKCRNLYQAEVIILIFVFAININTNITKAVICDFLPDEQLTTGYSVQSVYVAAGTMLTSCLPFIISGIGNHVVQEVSKIPEVIQLAFTIGAWLVLITGCCTLACKIKENSLPVPVEKSRQPVVFSTGMHRDHTVLRKVSLILFLAWTAITLIFIYFPVHVAKDIFHGPQGSIEYTNGIAWSGICYGYAAVIQFIVSLIVPVLSKKFREHLLLFFLFMFGALGLLADYTVTGKCAALLSMTGYGIIMAGVNIIPFSILARMPEKEQIGMNLGIINVFITLPGILIPFTIIPLIQKCGSGIENILIIPVLFMLLAGIFTLFLFYKRKDDDRSSDSSNSYV